MGGGAVKLVRLTNLIINSNPKVAVNTLTIDGTIDVSGSNGVDMFVFLLVELIE